MLNENDVETVILMQKTAAYARKEGPMEEKKEHLKEDLCGYVNRLEQIRKLSSPGLEGLSTASAYSYVLRENFKRIGKLAEENRAFINDVLNPFLESGEKLDEETVETILQANDDLLNAMEAETIDLPIASMLTDRLYEDSEKKNEQDYHIMMLDKEIETAYLLFNMTKRALSSEQVSETFRRNGLNALEALLKYLDKDVFAALSPESKECVIIDSRYGASLYEYMDASETELILHHNKTVERALEIAHDPFYREQLPDYEWNYHIFRAYDYLAQVDASCLDEATRKKIADYSEKYMEMWRTDPEYYSEYSEYVEIERLRLRNQYIAGNIPRQEYLEKALEIFKNRDPYAYTSAGFITNIAVPAEYIHFLEEEDLNEETLANADNLYRSALSYIFRMPKMGLLSGTLEHYSQMLMEFREFPGTISFEKMGLRSLAALHPPTYIHSRMVAAISRVLAGYLYDSDPELFSSVQERGDADDAQYKEMVLDYTFHAALCHDFGKLMIIDTIFVYGRKLLDFEFDLIKSHPNIGCMLLSGHPSTAAYADVAKGHHVWYDCSHGYPEGFNTFGSPVKTVIDIVLVADCMDAATDTVGRSYNRGKTLDDYIEEVVKDAGSRYAPWAPALLKNETVKKKLEDMLENERMQIYRETFELLSKVNERGMSV